MRTQHITLSLPRELLIKVRRLAERRQTSVSDLLARELEKLVQQEDAYVQARRRHLDQLERAADLGTGGPHLTGRDALHERG